MEYTLKSERLGLRNWIPEDIPKMVEISGDPEVMKHFPAVATPAQTQVFIQRMSLHFEEHGFCYFAVDLLETGEFIGFIGMMWQTWEGEYTPFFDIGWRLKTSAWGRGYATEGARICLEAAFDLFGLAEVFSTCPVVNKPSEHVMKKIGMQKVTTFDHPRLKYFPTLRECLLYRKGRP